LKPMTKKDLFKLFNETKSAELKLEITKYIHSHAHDYRRK